MFIELAEFLRCPAGHAEQSYCVVVPDRVLDREIQAGSIGCPVCRREYPIVNGVAVFDDVLPESEEPASVPDASTIHTLLGLTGPGGYVVLVGSADSAAQSLGPLLGDVHLVAVNPPDVSWSSGRSVLCCRGRIPLRDTMARGVVVGAECASEHWLQESVRVLLNGLRLVALAEDVTVPGVEPLATGQGMCVGRKR
jgi:uncharacterized protein YbaR (Trm112 family)